MKTFEFNLRKLLDTSNSRLSVIYGLLQNEMINVDRYLRRNNSTVFANRKTITRFLEILNSFKYKTDYSYRLGQRIITVDEDIEDNIFYFTNGRKECKIVVNEKEVNIQPNNKGE